MLDDHHPAADSLGSLPSSRLQIGWHNDFDFACQSVGALGSGSVNARTIKLSTLRMNRIPFRCLMSRSFFREILRLSGRLVDVSISGAEVPRSGYWWVSSLASILSLVSSLGQKEVQRWVRRLEVWMRSADVTPLGVRTDNKTHLLVYTMSDAVYCDTHSP